MASYVVSSSKVKLLTFVSCVVLLTSAMMRASDALMASMILFVVMSSCPSEASDSDSSSAFGVKPAIKTEGVTKLVEALEDDFAAVASSPMKQKQ